MLFLFGGESEPTNLVSAAAGDAKAQKNLQYQVDNSYKPQIVNDVQKMLTPEEEK